MRHCRTINHCNPLHHPHKFPSIRIPLRKNYSRNFKLQLYPLLKKLLIAEKLLQADGTGPRWAQMQNLNMLTCTEGKERTLAEYEALLRRVGFSEVLGHTTPSPLDAVLAVK